MTPEESQRLSRIERDVTKLTKVDHTGFGTKLMVFFLFINFLIDGCHFN